jgi:hypothetical protein
MQLSASSLAVIGGKVFVLWKITQEGNSKVMLRIICEEDLHLECYLWIVKIMNKFQQGYHNEVFCLCLLLVAWE